MVTDFQGLRQKLNKEIKETKKLRRLKWSLMICVILYGLRQKLK